MMSNNEPYFTHIKLQTSDFIRKSVKFIIVLFVLNIIIIGSNVLQNYFKLQSGPLQVFNILLLYEGAFFFIFSPMSIAVRPVKDMTIQKNDINPNRFLKGSFIDKILSHEFVVRKTNVYGLVGFITGSFLIILSIVIDMLFITKKII